MTTIVDRTGQEFPDGRAAGALTIPMVRRVGDARFLLRRHRRLVGRWANPLMPRTFNDWILRRLILVHDPLHARLSDKVALRSFVIERLGRDACVPLLGVWEDVAALERSWDDLPSALVLKPNHASAMTELIHDREQVDRAAVLARARSWLQTNYYHLYREWGYRKVRARLLAERLVPPPPGEEAVVDIRLYMFSGRLGLLRLTTRVNGSFYGTAFDAALRPLSFALNGRPPRDLPPPPAHTFARMLGLAEALSAATDFVRVDLLEDGPRLYVGEVTCFPDAGAGLFDPPLWDEWLGTLWRAGRARKPFPATPA
jgi:hypothetical protein